MNSSPADRILVTDASSKVGSGTLERQFARHRVIAPALPENNRLYDRTTVLYVISRLPYSLRCHMYRCVLGDFVNGRLRYLRCQDDVGELVQRGEMMQARTPHL